jgi:dTDP-4-dehydrorhamnose reductase
VQRILELAAERETLSVVDDQFGSPTYAPDLAELTVALMKNGARGILNAANSGQASWFELASAAVEMAHLPCQVTPIPTSGYPTRAKRPPYSVLDLTETARLAGYTPVEWQDALGVYVADLMAAAGGAGA